MGHKEMEQRVAMVSRVILVSEEIPENLEAEEPLGPKEMMEKLVILAKITTAQACLGPKERKAIEDLKEDLDHQDHLGLQELMTARSWISS